MPLTFNKTIGTHSIAPSPLCFHWPKEYCFCRLSEKAWNKNWTTYEEKFINDIADFIGAKKLSNIYEFKVNESIKKKNYVILKILSNFFLLKIYKLFDKINRKLNFTSHKNLNIIYDMFNDSINSALKKLCVYSNSVYEKK